jgi:hypothetical protein
MTGVKDVSMERLLRCIALNGSQGAKLTADMTIDEKSVDWRYVDKEFKQQSRGQQQQGGHHHRQEQTNR